MPRNVNRVPVPSTDWDGAWKEAIQQLLPDFLLLLFPAVHALIDWNQTPIFLEQELRRVTRRIRRRKKVVDKLLYEEEKRMPTISPYQRRFIAKTKRDAVLNALSVRFRVVPDDIAAMIQNIEDLEQLDKLHESAILAETMDTFRSEL